jgi:hypothetical protein
VGHLNCSLVIGRILIAKLQSLEGSLVSDLLCGGATTYYLVIHSKIVAKPLKKYPKKGEGIFVTEF